MECWSLAFCITPRLHHSTTPFRLRIIRQLHDVVEKPSQIISTGLQDVHEALIGTGNRFKLFDAGELALVRTVIGEVVAIDDFDGAKSSHDTLGQPHLS